MRKGREQRGEGQGEIRESRKGKEQGENLLKDSAEEGKGLRELAREGKLEEEGNTSFEFKKCWDHTNHILDTRYKYVEFVQGYQLVGTLNVVKN